MSLALPVGPAPPSATAGPAPMERFDLAVAGDRLAGVLHRPLADRAPCVIACHGLGASKDSDKYLMLADALVGAGLALARFDFRGSGESGGRLADATIATRLADLDAVIDWAAAHPGLRGQVGLMGSSLGGFVALWAAARRRPGPRAVVTWNAPASLRDLGRLDLSGPAAPGPALVAEVRAGRFADAPDGVAGVLVIQGEADEVVPLDHGRRLHERAVDPRALVLIAGADHRLSEPAHRREAVRRSAEWLGRHLA